MSFTEIDMKTWPRTAEYRFFSQTSPTALSVTAEIDITHFLAVCHETGVKFTPVFLWIVTTQINREPAFRMGMKEGKLGIYDEVHPVFPLFHEDDKSLSNLWLEYKPDFADFYKDYQWVLETYGQERRFYARRDKVMPENTFVASYMPWLKFTSFSSQNLNNAPRYMPSVEWGKYTTGADGKTVMPVSITVHHAVADGWHIANFYENIQVDCDSFAP